jgi:hypothetical protein
LWHGPHDFVNNALPRAASPSAEVAAATYLHVGIGLVERDRHQDIDDTPFHAPISRDSLRLRKG